MQAAGRRELREEIRSRSIDAHSFELTRVGGKPTAGIVKDVVMLGGFQEVEMDFVADNPGDTLFHCHRQLHMDFRLDFGLDFGFMALLRYA